jgi:hypothetical protein
MFIVPYYHADLDRLWLPPGRHFGALDETETAFSLKRPLLPLSRDEDTSQELVSAFRLRSL